MRIAIAAVFVLASCAALAEPFPPPESDADQECRNIKRQNNDKRPLIELYNECFDQQQKSYDRWKALWNEMTQDEQLECLHKREGGEPSRLSPWGRLIFCVAATKVDPDRNLKRRQAKERHEAEELQDLRRRDDEQRPSIVKRELRY